MLVATNILSFAAALGLGIFFFENVFGFPGEDPSLPLLSFVFLAQSASSGRRAYRRKAP